MKDFKSPQAKCAGLLAVAFLLFTLGTLYGRYISALDNGKVQPVLSLFQEKELPIYSVKLEEEDKRIALSFDAAWGAEDFETIMEILDAHDTKVTFFMTGEWAQNNPECVKRLVAEGHELGNHSQNHYDMTNLSVEAIKSELMEVHNYVKSLTGYEMQVFRPPYGAYNDMVINQTKACGYYAVQWSVDSLDWKNYGVQDIIDRVSNHKELKPGAIILCHNGAQYTAKALDELLTVLENKDYEIVPVSKLIYKENYEIDVTGCQCKVEKE